MPARLRILCAFAFSAAVLIGVVNPHVVAQTTTGTILGTVTDASGGAVPDASVQLTNTGTGATQVVNSDAQGRYRLPAVAVGNYDVQAQKAGFEVVVHRGIVVSVGADVVVDLSLPVGQVTQSVTVEGNVTQVETTSSTLSTLIEPTQMRELPLNGRGIEQLVLLSPGVTTMTAIGEQPTNGFGASYSVSGSRSTGVWELLDDNDITDYSARGSGAGTLGTSLGIDSVAEFQMLTNTYSAQYGGAGSVVVSVTRSGTNAFHGSAYEFFRNDGLDARNYFDPPHIPLYQQNQFGGTLGGPIKKDKMFFFVNYEGLRYHQGLPQVYTLPDAEAHSGFYVPSATSGYVCANNPAIAYAGGAGNAACAATIPAVMQQFLQFSPIPSTTIGPVVPLTFPNSTTPEGIVDQTETFVQPGSENYVVARYDWTISSKDSLFARYLYDHATLSPEFLSTPTVSALAPLGWANSDHAKNQFISIEEKRVQSNNLILSTRLGYSRTLLNTFLGEQENPVFLFDGPQNFGCQNDVSGLLMVQPLINPNFTQAWEGANACTQVIQNKSSIGEDIFWTKGAHSIRFGGSFTKEDTWKLGGPSAGTWGFSTMQQVLTASPTNYAGTCFSSIFPACAAAGFPNVPIAPLTFLDNIYGMYVQDDWKVRPTVTLNLGLRYEPESNPTVAKNDLYLFQNALNLPLSVGYSPNEPMPGCTTPARSSCPGAPGNPQASLPFGVTGYQPISGIFLKNPSYHNIDPRIGFAWDPFKDHKTSIRGGYGIFHMPLLPIDFGGFANTPPGTSVSQNCPCVGFPTPFQGAAGAAAIPSATSNMDSGITTTPYMEQYNLTVQRGFGSNMTLSVGYVGSHGVKLEGLSSLNPNLPSGVPGAIAVPAGQTLLPYPAVGASLQCGPGLTPVAAPSIGCANTTGASVLTAASSTGAPIVDPTSGQMSYSNVMCTTATLLSASPACKIVYNNRIDPAISFWASETSGYWSVYNSLQASFVRRFANNFQLQASYTWANSECTASDLSYAEGASIQQDPYNNNGQAGPCVFLIRQDFYINGLYILPFKGNRLITGWQVGGLFTHHTGNFMFVSNGWDSGQQSRSSGSSPQEDRPDYIAGCKQVLGTVANWINTACYTTAPIGENGNEGNDSIQGPTDNELDFSTSKMTKLTERFNLQFRAEIFNIFNDPWFRNPGQPGIPVFSQAATITPACATTPSACSALLGNVGSLRATDNKPRQIQFGLKLIF